MGKVFNTSGPCFPDIHYMVDISSRIDYIVDDLIQKNMYFTINRTRQYGKTTTLDRLYARLKDDYCVFWLSFEAVGSAAFTDEYQFCRVFLRLMKSRIIYGMTTGLAKNSLEEINTGIQTSYFGFQMLTDLIANLCTNANKPVVLIIDEVDQASNNQIFLDFLGTLRSMYLHRRYVTTFQSVILVGVYDIRNLKVKLQPKDKDKHNSPWNIAADFNVDMSFTVAGIEGMLSEYERDYQTGMDIHEMAELLYDYTSGYPFLVSRICKLIDEEISGTEAYPDKASAWTKAGFLEAVKILLVEKNPLFESLSGKLTAYPELRQIIYSILVEGKKIAFNLYNNAVDIAVIFGFVKNEQGTLVIANRIFETQFYKLFLLEKEAIKA